MSLNGLDDLKVQEAHGAAAAEPGGWYDALALALTPMPSACSFFAKLCAFVQIGSS